MQDRLIEIWRARPRLIVGSAMGAAALVTLGAFAFGSGQGSTAARGPGLDIAVVAPVEPEIQPGERMEVGALVDGFDAQSIPHAEPRADADQDYYVEQPAYTDDAPPPRVRRYASEGYGDEGYGGDRYSRDPYPRGEQPDEWRSVERNGDRMGFGFDGPRPESGAERDARRAQALAERRAARNQPDRRYMNSRPTGDPDAAFY